MQAFMVRPLSIGLCVGERVVEDVGVSVEVLRRIGFLGVRICREEASDDCVSPVRLAGRRTGADTTIHVDEADLFQVLMLGEAAVEVRQLRKRQRPTGRRVTPLTPGVPKRGCGGQTLNLKTVVIGDDRDRAQIVAVMELRGVGEGAGARCRRIHLLGTAERRHHGTGRIDVDAVINRTRHHMLGLLKMTRVPHRDIGRLFQSIAANDLTGASLVRLRRLSASSKHCAACSADL